MTIANASGARCAPAHAVDEVDATAEEPAVRVGWRVRALQWAPFRAIAANAGRAHALLAEVAAALADRMCRLRQLVQRASGAARAPERGEPDCAQSCGVTGEPQPDSAPLLPEAAEPWPPRRRRGLLAGMGMMLVGGVGGAALAYTMLAQLLERRAHEISRQEITLSERSRSLQSVRQELEQTLAKQAETEARLAKAQARLAQYAGGEPGAAPSRERAGRSSGESPRDGAGDCTLRAGNIRAVLKGCIDAMNRD